MQTGTDPVMVAVVCVVLLGVFVSIGIGLFIGWMLADRRARQNVHNDLIETLTINQSRLVNAVVTPDPQDALNRIFDDNKTQADIARAAAGEEDPPMRRGRSRRPRAEQFDPLSLIPNGD